MRLNPECIRDILLAVEEETGYKTSLEITKGEPLPHQLEKYNFDTIAYHINQCYMSNLLLKGTHYFNMDFLIKDLTPFGHEFLNNIRQDTNWKKVKEVSAKIGSTSLDAITQIASHVIAEIVKSQFGLSI